MDRQGTAAAAPRPIMALLDLLGRRWTLRVLWELREPAASARELAARCDGMSTSVLWRRTGELKAAGLVELDGARGLRLTQAGIELSAQLVALDGWATRWAARAG